MIKDGNLKELDKDLTFHDDVHVLDRWVPEEIVYGLKMWAKGDAGWTYSNSSQGDKRSKHWGIGVAGYVKRPKKINGYHTDQQYAKLARQQWDKYVKECPALGKFWEFIKKESPFKHQLPDIPNRALFNGSTGGHGDISHADTQDYYNPETEKLVEGPRYISHVIHLTDDLDVDSGGQTEFYSQDKSEIVGSISHKEGRVILFDGRIPHAGKAPWKHYTGLRITLGIQTALTGKVDRQPDSEYQGLQKLYRGEDSAFYNKNYFLKDFIKEYHNAVPDDVCDELIEIFDNNKSQAIKGEITDSKGVSKVDSSMKVSSDIMITGYPEFKRADELMHKYATQALHQYIEDVPLFDISAQGFAKHNPDDQYLKFETMKLRRYPTNGFFRPHIDTVGPTTMDRLLAMIIYLNDVEEGGETCIGGTTKPIKCEKGKILIKPCSWLVMHKSAENISGPKYIGVAFVRPIFLH